MAVVVAEVVPRVDVVCLLEVRMERGSIGTSYSGKKGEKEQIVDRDTKQERFNGFRAE
jgi:hypothetical protein